MQTLTFKTNINCGGCEAIVSPFLDKAVGKNNWKVDTTNVDKVLSVSVENMEAKYVIAVMNAIGFKAEQLS